MKTRTRDVWEGIVILIVGILLCFSVINPNDLINWMIAISLILGGTTLVTLSIATLKSLISNLGISGGLLLSLGVFSIPSIGGFNFLGMIAIALMVFGSMLFVNMVYGFIYHRELSRNILDFIIGALFFTLGICLWLIPSFRNFAGLVLGILMILYAIILFVSAYQDRDIIVIAKDK